MIRKYKDSDLDELLDAWYSASKVAHYFLNTDFFEQERRDIATIYLPQAETWVCEQAETVTGFIALIENEVGGLFVHTEHQGKGVGRLLMDHAVKSRTSLELNVFEKNEIGRRFYDRYGFIKIGEVFHQPTQMKQIRMQLKS